MKDELIELERRRCVAFDAMDLGALEEILGDDYVHVHGNGILDLDRAEYFTTLATRMAGKYETVRSDLQVRDYGHVALVVGPFHAKLWPEDGRDFREVIAIAAGLWRRKGDTWEAVSFQVTKIV